MHNYNLYTFMKLQDIAKTLGLQGGNKTKMLHGTEHYKLAGAKGLKKRWAKADGHDHIYNPIKLDRLYPCVQFGEAIKEGERVMVTKKQIEPLRIFRGISDKKNNSQHVHRDSLEPILD